MSWLLFIFIILIGIVLLSWFAKHPDSKAEAEADMAALKGEVQKDIAKAESWWQWIKALFRK